MAKKEDIVSLKNSIDECADKLREIDYSISRYTEVFIEFKKTKDDFIKMLDKRLNGIETSIFALGLILATLLFYALLKL